jgi:hypothetical protein
MVPKQAEIPYKRLFKQVHTCMYHVYTYTFLVFAKNSPKFQTPGTHCSVTQLLQPSTPCCTVLLSPSLHLPLPLAIPLPPIVQTLAEICLTNSSGPLMGATVLGSLLNDSQTKCGLRQSSKSSQAHASTTRCSRASLCSKCFSVSSISSSSNRYRSSLKSTLQSMQGQPPYSIHMPVEPITMKP